MGAAGSQRRNHPVLAYTGTGLQRQSLTGGEKRYKKPPTVNLEAVCPTLQHLLRVLVHPDRRPSAFDMVKRRGTDPQQSTESVWGVFMKQGIARCTNLILHM